MNTKIDVVNDASNFVAENVKEKDATGRLFLAAVSLVALFVVVPKIQIMNYLEVLAVYLFSTAIIRWDPFYAIAGIRLDSELSKPHAHSEASLSSSVERGANSHAANESDDPIKDLRKAS
jgi:hypothetical protein